MTQEVAPAQHEVNQLRELAENQKDHVYVDSLQADLDARRLEAGVELGSKVSKFVQLPDGSVAPEAEVKASQERGEEASGPYAAGRRA